MRRAGESGARSEKSWPAGDRAGRRRTLGRRLPFFPLGRAVFHAEQGGGLGAEAAQLFVLAPVRVHPPGGLVVPLAGLLLVAQLLMRHGQEEPVEAVTPPEQT